MANENNTTPIESYGFNNKYPYTDMHELNLDWILKVVYESTTSAADIKNRLDDLEADNETMMQLYNEIISGDFPESVKEGFELWMRENALDLIGELATMVFFGLTDDGYFVAYVPESWDDLQFGTTGLDTFPADIGYGHLTISY